MTEIVITGLGATTPLGGDLARAAESPPSTKTDATYPVFFL